MLILVLVVLCSTAVVSVCRRLSQLREQSNDVERAGGSGVRWPSPGGNFETRTRQTERGVGRTEDSCLSGTRVCEVKRCYETRTARRLEIVTLSVCATSGGTTLWELWQKQGKRKRCGAFVQRRMRRQHVGLEGLRLVGKAPRSKQGNRWLHYMLYDAVCCCCRVRGADLEPWMQLAQRPELRRLLKPRTELIGP